MNVFIRLKSYILPLTAIVFIPAVIIVLCNNTMSRNITILILGGLIIILGLSLLICSIKLLEKQGKGTLAPWNPTRKLVISGPYKYIRNPMITGVLIVILGTALIFISLCLLIWAVIFLYSILFILFIVRKKD